MSASPNGSETALLHGLIGSAVGLAALATVVWAATFGVRIARLRTARRRSEATARLTSWVLEAMAQEAPPAAAPDWPADQRRLLSHLLRDLIAGTRGRDRNRCVALLATTGLRQDAARALHRRAASARQEAVEVLSHFDDDAAVAAVQSALDDEDPAVRLTAARALVRRDRAGSLRALLERLRLSPEDPPLALADLLDDLAPALQREAIGLLKERSLPPEWTRQLALALARGRVLDAFDALVALRGATEVRLRAAAWVALERLGDPRAAAFLPEGLGDPATDVRQTATECAAQLGGPETVPALARLLGSDDWWERHRAASALLALGADGRDAVERHLAQCPGDEAVNQAREEAKDGG
jgi:HEAT repeat protein